MSPRVAVGFIEPCPPVTASKPPSGDGWIHDIKHDGYRMMVRRDASGIRLITRRGYDWTSRFPAIARAAKALRAVPVQCPLLGRIGSG